MDANSLRELQAPLKDRYRKEPEAAVITLKAKGSLDEGISCKVETGRTIALAGLHPATGGSGMELCSGDMLLEALVACSGVTLRAVSTALGIDVRSGTVEAEGDLDFKGHAGRRQGGARWLQVDQAQVQSRHRRSRRQDRPVDEAHRALLRGAADDPECGRSKRRGGA